ncbi:ribonuclease HII [Mycoplasmopsis felis]|uniref:ribonuclease HII n=1 Tax=Mycoplasmopsis felis TaxID=33923 RepID=UPI002AFF49C7|nr:ribonuclease HII [Mycoplasmopsis felis]WQQ08057.1 ribonuclease HII [Mycoplasmopsis felis]
MLDYELKFLKNYKNIAGTDEVGRGCLAGPLVVACVILQPNYINPEIKDSKKLSKTKREKLYDEIIKNCLEYKIITKDVKEINNYNPKEMSIQGMEQCIISLNNKPDIVLTDYEKINIPYKQINLTKGDSVSQSIAAASILAKVYRDKLMVDYHKLYPEYDFKNNKGYGTNKHLEAIEKYGVLKDFHRLKYKPIKDKLNN